MTTIEIKKIERNSDANRSRKLAGGKIVYDYHVFIDGEHRATFWRAVLSVGFDLHDANMAMLSITKTGTNYKGDPTSWREKVTRISTGIFAHTIRVLLNANEIPTTAELMMDRIRNEADKEDRERDDLAFEILHAKQRAAERMFDAINVVLEHARHDRSVDVFEIDTVVFHQLALAKEIATYKPSEDEDDE